MHLLVELYGKRERIENDIRSLKYTLGMEMLYAHSPDVIEKELVLGTVAYNLVRSCLAAAAQKLKIEPRKISFSRGAELTRIFGNKLHAAKSKEERNQILNKYITALAQSKLPDRKTARLEPRKLVRRKERYPVMKRSRKVERQLLFNPETSGASMLVEVILIPEGPPGIGVLPNFALWQGLKTLGFWEGVRGTSLGEIPRLCYAASFRAIASCSPREFSNWVIVEKRGFPVSERT